MATLYEQEAILIWIHTPRQVAEKRLAEDLTRKTRVEDDSMKVHFNLLFEPIGTLGEDVSRFTQSLKSLL